MHIKKKFCGIVLPFLLAIIPFFSGAQELSPFGSFTPADIALKECPFDKEADAVVLLDHAFSNYDDDYRLVTDRRIRFKILTQKGIDRANIHIRYYSGDDFESIRGIDAVILTPGNGRNEVRQGIDRKEIYTRKLNSLASEVTFTLPNVKVGSIIEYKYTSEMKHYGGLREWIFQKELPVMLSVYDLNIIPNSEFTYSVHKSEFLPIEVKPDNKGGSIHFAMRNVPGLRGEAYMAAERDYLQRVNFQFSGHYGSSGKRKFTTTWKELTKELLFEKNFGGQLDKGLPNTEAVKSLWEQAPTPYEKMQRIHTYVRANLSWNNIYSKYSDNGIKEAWEKKRGMSGDINLILLNLLLAAGLEAAPILVSERDHGKVDTTYPFLDQFNKVAAYVTIDGNTYILDGTDYSTPSYMVPFNLLNTTGFVVDKKSGGFTRITDSKRKNRSYINLLGTIDETGQLYGKGLINHFDYAKIEKRESYLSNKAAYEEALVKPYAAMKIDSFNVKGTEADSLAMSHTFNLTYALNKSGQYYLLGINLFAPFEKNPFISDNRFSNIDFGCRHNYTVNGSFALPANLVPETVPKNMKLVMPDKSMTMSRDLQITGNTIQVRVNVSIDKTDFGANEYPLVKAFYKQMFDLLNEPIVLKAK